MITMRTAVPAIVMSLASAASAVAGFDRFAITSEIGTTSFVGNYQNAFGTYEAEVISNVFGRVMSTMTASDGGVLMTSDMTIPANQVGTSTGTAYYTFTETTTIQVTWNWTDVDQAGNWQVTQVGGTSPLARLAFNALSFATVGNGIAKASAGVAYVTVGPGEYELSTSYMAVQMPATSSVEFTWVPAPGALALLGAAGLVGTRRRR
jgi:uncharacterized protein (TIGR03382 family)